MGVENQKSLPSEHHRHIPPKRAWNLSLGYESNMGNGFRFLPVEGASCECVHTKMWCCLSGYPQIHESVDAGGGFARIWAAGFPSRKREFDSIQLIQWLLFVLQRYARNTCWRVSRGIDSNGAYLEKETERKHSLVVNCGECSIQLYQRYGNLVSFPLFFSANISRKLLKKWDVCIIQATLILWKPNIKRWTKSMVTKTTERRLKKIKMCFYTKHDSSWESWKGEKAYYLRVCKHFHETILKTSFVALNA